MHIVKNVQENSLSHFTAYILCVYSNITFIMKNKIIPSKVLAPRKSIKRAANVKSRSPKWVIKTSQSRFEWSSKMDRVNIIRKGLPYESIEVISIDLPKNWDSKPPNI